jgi:ribose-phosphate pyrophosphokinase
MFDTLLIGEETKLIHSLEKKYSKRVKKLKKIWFSNNNFIYEIKEELPQKINIIADLSKKVHTNFLGLLFILDFIKSKNIQVKNLVFPYFPYSRSNKKHNYITNNLNAFIEALNNFEIERIISFDTHFNSQDESFRAKFKSISQVEIYKEEIQRFNEYNKTIILGPDQGSRNRVEFISRYLSVNKIVLQKKRIGHENKLKFNIDKTNQGIIQDCSCILIFDDEICSGKTLITLINQIKTINNKVPIFIYITHSFLENYQILFNNQIIKELHVTNTVNNSGTANNKIFEKDIASKLMEHLLV